MSQHTSSQSTSAHTDIVTCPHYGARNRLPAATAGVPCRIVESGVRHVAKEFAGRLKVTKVNVDAPPHIAQHYRAQSIPMLLWIRDGEVRRQQVGALPPPALVDWVTAALDGR